MYYFSVLLILLRDIQSPNLDIIISKIENVILAINSVVESVYYKKEAISFDYKIHLYPLVAKQTRTLRFQNRFLLLFKKIKQINTYLIMHVISLIMSNKQIKEI